MADPTQHPPAVAEGAYEHQPPAHPDNRCEHSPPDDEEVLFRLHHERLVRLVQCRLGIPRELAEDACSSAWVQLLRKQPRRDQIVGWLYTVAKHEAFVLMRRRRREPPCPELAWVVTIAELDEIVAAREALRLIAQLKPQQRQVLSLLAEGHSYKGICELTGHTYTWVNRHISEGRRALRCLMERS
jgi:DNA-directed RNA polymerase specialized sigma24 family protein